VLPGTAYVSRQQCLDPAGIRRTKKAIETAFKTQLAGLGFSMVEVVSTCNTNWHMTPLEAIGWAKEKMLAYFPVGDTKVTDAVKSVMRKK
jgi:2-oxoglutarate ferredoxin oxidoreductase subunit beta